MTLNGSMRGRILWNSIVVACFLLTASSHKAEAESRSLTDRDETGWQAVVLDRVKREADLSVPIADPRLIETLRFAVYDCWMPKRDAGAERPLASGRAYEKRCAQLEPRRS